MTIDEAVYTILERIGVTSDDADWYRYVQRELDNARGLLLRRMLKNGMAEIPPTAFLNYECLIVDKIYEGCENCPRTQLELPLLPLDLPYDLGVYTVRRPGGKSLARLGSAGQAAMLSESRFSSGGWYRIADTLFLEGGYAVNAKFHVTIIPASTSSMEGTDLYPASASMMSEILDAVEAVCRRKMESPVDITSDGKQEANRN